MGEAQGRGSTWKAAACDVCFTSLTRLGSRLRFVPRHPPLGKICATLDGVRRLQRLGYREGVCLCRARRGNPYRGGRNSLFAPASAFPLPKRKTAQSAAMTGAGSEWHRVLLETGGSRAGAYLRRRSPLGQAEYVTAPNARISCAMCHSRGSLLLSPSKR